MRPRHALLALLVAVTLAGCSGSPADNPSGDQNATVEITGKEFTPTTRNIEVGSVVEWTNTDSNKHTVTADGGSFDSGDINAGAEWTHTFSKAGEFAYHCKLHPEMRGTVKVGKT